jgi:hypothetical protein
MSRSSPYSWFDAHKAAAIETGFSRLRQRIDLALRTIEKSLDGPNNRDNAGFSEIQNELRALQMLSTDENR